MTIIDKAAERLSEPEWNLPEPKGFMSIKSYIKQAVEPLIEKFKQAIKTASLKYIELKKKFNDLNMTTEYLKKQVIKLEKTIDSQDFYIKQLKVTEKEMDTLETYLGTDRFEKQMEKAFEHEKMLTRRKTNYRYIERGDEFER